MHLDARGHPLHTRALSVVLAQRADGRLDAHASLVDVRKRGVVPVAGDLQASGVMHDMRLDGIIDPAGPTLDVVVASQPTVPFEPTPITAGETCRDPIHVVEALAGTRLDEGFAQRAGGTLGGPRACSHILTLAHLLGSTAAGVLARARTLPEPAPRWRAGERMFRRDLVVDGLEPEAGLVELAVQLTDLYLAPAPAVARPMQRFGEEVAVRLLARVEFPALVLVRVEAAERRRGAGDLDTAPWRDRADATGGLAGQKLGSGITAELLRRIGPAPGDRPLLDALLALAPTLIQCAAALSERWPAAYRDHPSPVGIGGVPDSCWMWRREGALVRARDGGGVPTPSRGGR
jgi:hypothetical protein